jgi:hypothetical protein
MSFMDPDQREHMAKNAMTQTEADKQTRDATHQRQQGQGPVLCA